MVRDPLNYCLWGEVINAPTFGSYVNLINNISWRCFVMDFCHSGGFNNFPDPVPTAIVFSCRADQVCYNGDNGYGVFTYYFNAALRGCIADYASHRYYPYEYLNLVDADYNDDGEVTIKEAYNYAYNRTTSIYYSSTPWIAMSSTLVGEVLVLGQPFNDDPVADAGGPGYYSGAAGAPITFDGSSSYDSDGTIISDITGTLETGPQARASR